MPFSTDGNQEQGFTPKVKQPGDLARAQEWNEAMAEIVRLGLVQVEFKVFGGSSPYWTGSSNDDVDGFSLDIQAPTSGTIVAMMNALVSMGTEGKAIYLGPKIDNFIVNGNRGGVRALEVNNPRWIGTAAFNARHVASGKRTVQVHANIDGGQASIAWGYLVVMFFPDK